MTSRGREWSGLGLLAAWALTSCGHASDLPGQCEALSSAGIPGVAISNTIVVTDREDLPDFCRVRGTVEPDIGFEARLPLESWNGKYYQSGCGGFCGGVYPDKPGFSNTINEALKLGFATITTDNGHEGGPGDAAWARGNGRAVEVYAHRGIYLAHRAGTALTRRFYDREPRREYFGGCSNGGRMAAMAAQRYPELFDGILGGAGVLNLSYSGGVYGSWVVQVNTDENGRRILDRRNFAAKLPALERAVMAQCDETDGRTDKVIGQPRRCEVAVGLLPDCGEARTDECFTAAEKGVLEKWYQGPRSSTGQQLFPGMPPGSERFLAAWFLDAADSIAVGNQLGGRYARYLGFEGGTPDDYSVLDFDFDDDPQRLAATGRLLDALDPDLRRFRDAGGKYLMWHGWADPLVLPDQSVVYYESVAEFMGGLDNIMPFYRLFMIPGHGHCWEMPSGLPEMFNPISVLDAWVESDEAPEKIHARARGAEAAVISDALLCPHPGTAIIPDAGDDIEDLQCPDE